MARMSAAAAWANTATATLWPLLGRDDWSGALSFGPPVPFACDYSAKAERATDGLVLQGGESVEFVARLMLYTERADIKRGDRVLIGTSTLADPIAAGAHEVRAVQRYGDTFDRRVDDYTVMT